MELESLFGLPAHPLIVHAAVVLVPLAAIGTVAIALSSRARHRLGWVVVGFGVVAFVAALLAQSSGEPLEQRVDESDLIEEHAELGDSMPWFALPIAITAAGVMVLDRRRRGSGDESNEATTVDGGRSPAFMAVAVLAVAASVVGTVRIAQVGHSGARATWQEIQDHPERTPGEGDEDGDGD